VKKSLALLMLLAAPHFQSKAREGNPVPVRYAEGVTHGFLVLQGLDSTVLSRGDMLQTSRGDTVETRTLFRFKDGSVFDETFRFTQKKVFILQDYHLIQRGPSFKDDLEVRVDRSTGKYTVISKDRKDDKVKTREGTIELPEDVYNGMLFLVAKNFSKGEGRKVHYIAFTPDPRMVEIEYTPLTSTKSQPSALPGVVVRYRLKPELGTFLKVITGILGKTPPDMYAWIVTETVPAFARFEGPLYMGGPIWRIETTGARIPSDSMVASK
jgi:hypothetical protein